MGRTVLVPGCRTTFYVWWWGLLRPYKKIMLDDGSRHDKRPMVLALIQDDLARLTGCARVTIQKR